MATVLVVNGTAAALTNINVGGDDIPAYSMGVDGAGEAATSVLTAAELDTLMGTAGVIVLAGASTEAQRRMACKVARVGTNPGK